MARKGLDEIWVSRMNDYRVSGERVATWCARHQVTERQFWYWAAKLKKAGQIMPPTKSAEKPQWVSVRVAETAASTASPILVKIGAAAIEVRPGFEPTLFAEVVRALKTLC